MLRQKSLTIILDANQLQKFTKENAFFGKMEWQPSIFLKTVPDSSLSENILCLTQINGELLKMCEKKDNKGSQDLNRPESSEL